MPKAALRALDLSIKRSRPFRSGLKTRTTSTSVLLCGLAVRSLSLCI